jgi:hypothetical protein
MTSLHSSISSSDASRYVRVLAIVLAALIAVLLTITTIGYSLGLVDAANQQIYDYQRDKIDNLERIDAAFVGDSSLGNAIDAALFSKLSGLASANLALNGSYGSGGAYNIVQALIARERPRLIVVMLSLDTMRRTDAFPGFYFSADTTERLRQSPLRILELFFSLKAARRTLDEIAQGGLHRPDEPIEADYLSQRTHPMHTSLVDEAAENPLLPEKIAASQLDYLARIATLCEEQDIVCVYAHGPIFTDYCRDAAAYVNALSAQIRATGLAVVPETPICMPSDDVGNTIDHVRPDLKQDYTSRYFERLRTFVASAPTAR